MKRLLPIVIALAAFAEPEVMVGAGWTWSPCWYRGWHPYYAPYWDPMGTPYDWPYGRYPAVGYESRMRLRSLDHEYAKLSESDSGALPSNVRIANPTNSAAWDRDFQMFFSAPRREKKDE